ncbi:hypothetical protein AOLI_G00189970 [Acnodon oligacanthus]
MVKQRNNIWDTLVRPASAADALALTVDGPHPQKEAVHLRLTSNEMEAKWIFPFMPVAVAFIVLRAETTAAASNISISYQGCNQNKTCLSTPDKCDPAASDSCFFLSAGLPLNSTNITFELSGQSSGYIAVAFSVNSQMDIYACDGGVKLMHTTLSIGSSSSLGNLSTEALVTNSVNGSTIQCMFTLSGLNVLIVNNSQLNISNIFLIKGNFINETLGTPEIKFPINSTATLFTVLSSIPNSIAFGANNATTVGGNNNNNSSSSNSNNTTTTSTTTTTTTTTTNNNNNSGGSGNNALQSTSAKAPLILIGAIVVALLSG